MFFKEIIAVCCKKQTNTLFGKFHILCQARGTCRWLYLSGLKIHLKL